MENNSWKLVLDKTDIVSLISEYVPLTKHGRNFMACCPFHSEKTPSFSVNAEKNIFTCFGCKKTGNAINFLMFYKNISALEALKILADKAKVDISEYLTRYEKSHQKTEQEMKILDVLQETNNFFQYHMILNKSENKVLSDFLEKRKLNKELIHYFEIGFAPEKENLYTYLINKNYSESAINNASVCVPSYNKNEIKENNFFFNRITFPIKDENGYIVGFSARDITNKNNNKYLNSSETLVFKKNKVLFNYWNAKDKISNTKEVFLVEGQFDVVALYKAGFENSVALMGTNLSHYHLELLKNSTINLFFDSDKAGQESTEKNLKIILYYASKLNLQVNIVVNKLTKDPDELYNLDKGVSLKETVKNKYDLSQYLINKYCSTEAFKEKNDIQKSSLLANMFEHAYYMQPQIYSLFKSKILENKILSDEVYSSFEKQYLKPNFSSDKNFLQHISKNEYEQYNQQSSNILHSSNKYNDYPNYNYEYHDYSEQNYNNLNFNSKPYWNMKNKELIGRSKDITLILKCILSQASYLDNLSEETFANINTEEENKIKKELICYIIDNKNKIKENNASEYIKNDNSLSNATKKDYLQALNDINLINEKDNISKNEFDKIVTNLNSTSEQETKPKLLIVESKKKE